METNNNRSKLARYLSPIDVWALSLGCIIGWGAFVMPGTTFLPIAGPLGTLIAMVLSALIMLIIGLNYSYLMSRYPGTGGVYAYTKAGLGRDHAFLSAWFLCLSYLALIPQNATALAVFCRALFSNALQRGFHYQVVGYDVYFGELAIAVAALVFLGLLAIFCKPLMQRLQTGLALLLLIGVILIVVLALPRLRFETIFSAFGSGASDPVLAVLSIVVLAPWAFVGFEVISLETAHFRFPVKRSWHLIVFAILFGGLIYISMSLVAVSVVPDGYSSWQDYIRHLDRFSGYAALPTFYAARELMGQAGLIVIAVTALSAVLTSVIGFYRASARILSNMAEDHILTPQFSSPRFCFIFLMLLSVLISFFGRTALAWVVDLSSFGAIIGFGYTSVVAMKVAHKERNRGRQFSGMVGLFISVCFGMTQLLPNITSVETMGAESYLLLALWCLLGFVFYWRTMSQNLSEERSSGTVTISSLFFLLLYSAVVWFVKKTLNMVESEAAHVALIRNSVVMLSLALAGLIVMLLIHSSLRNRQIRLEQEKIRAIESSKAKSQFLFNMSHDIRTPMNAIIGYTHLALSPETTVEKKDEYLQKISSSGQQLLGIINDVLDMSRIESGKMELDTAPMDLEESLQDLRNIFTTQMESKGINFSVDSVLEDRYVLSDRNRWNRVLLNLLSNALKFTPESGSVSVELKQLGRQDGIGSYELRVRDTGIGMSTEFAEHMFTPFERERTSTVSGIQGTGLGLSITKGIVDMLDGTIDVSTTPGEGTEFIVTLSMPVTEAPSAQPVSAEPELSVQTRSAHFLLVEDNPINMEIALMILQQAGYTADTAVNGQIAVDLISSAAPGTYDAVLMDIQMPVMDGYEATKAIRALPDPERAGIPIIALTANAFAEDRQAAETVGMQGHIAKPLDVEKMMSTLNTVLDQSRQQTDETVN